MHIIDCRTCRNAGRVRCQCEDTGVVKDGQTISVGLMLSDAAAGALRINDYAERKGVSASQAAYEMRLGDAWKQKDRIRPAEAQESRPAAPAPISQADNGQAAYEARLRTAWQGRAA